MAARINIETDLWIDPRFQDLMILVKNRHAAKGMFIEALTLAQQYWFPNKDPIPFDVFERSGLNPLIDVGLAELKDNGVYIHGSKDRFAWLFKSSEAGKKSAEVRSTKVEGTSTDLEGTLTDLEPDLDEVEGCSTSSSSSFSSSFSDSNSSSVTPGVSDPPAPPDKPSRKRKPPKEPGISTKETWEAYSKAYLERHRVEPIRNKTVNSQMLQFVGRVGANEAPDIAKFYLSHNDAFYVKNKHPVGMLLKDAEKLRTEWITGNKTTFQEAKQAETTDYYKNQLERIRRGEL